MRVDKFIFHHVEYLDGKLKLTSGEANQEVIMNKNISSKIFSPVKRQHEDVDEVNVEMDKTERDSLNETENWRCKIKAETSANNRVSKRLKSNYLTPCADWDFIETNKTIGIPLLKNGSLCNATTVDKGQILVRETCAFDSIFQIVASGMGMCSVYKIDMIAFTTSNAFIKLIIEILTRGKIIANDYGTRAMILCNIPIFSKRHCTRTISSLNANCNAAHLAEYLFENIPSCTTSHNCDTCAHNYKRTSPICHINVDELFNHGLHNMQQAIDDVIAKKITTCNECKNKVNRTTSYGHHLIIDTSILSDPNYIKTQNISRHNYLLDDVAKTVKVNGNNYYLASIVSYIKYGSGFSNGHYVAYTYTGLNWYKYDDMTTKRCVANTTEEICPHVIFYIKYNVHNT